MSKTIRSIAIAAIAGISSASAVAAEPTNPLHPSFYGAKVKIATKAAKPAIPYVHTGDAAGQIVDSKHWIEVWLEDDSPAVRQARAYTNSNNPLHPSYGQKTVPGKWMVTGYSNSRPYVDANNPLRPSYKRS